MKIKPHTWYNQNSITETPYALDKTDQIILSYPALYVL